MFDTVVIEMQIDAELKDQAEKVLTLQGYTLEEAIILFLKETVRLGRIPFEVNDEMLARARGI